MFGNDFAQVLYLGLHWFLIVFSIGLSVLGISIFIREALVESKRRRKYSGRTYDQLTVFDE